ncbi:hypothetical protein DL98DRAFT_570280 [Cadophora sp. DSE1049]|nr:hypothetical protein DL98DRAFT_570280 [Cadophora sp. DSE1049]
MAPPLTVYPTTHRIVEKIVSYDLIFNDFQYFTHLLPLEKRPQNVTLAGWGLSLKPLITRTFHTSLSTIDLDFIRRPKILAWKVAEWLVIDEVLPDVEDWNPAVCQNPGDHYGDIPQRMSCQAAWATPHSVSSTFTGRARRHRQTDSHPLKPMCINPNPDLLLSFEDVWIAGSGVKCPE